MIKSGPVEDLAQAGFHYLTANTKPQIQTLLAVGVLQMEQLAAEVCQIQQEGVRYVLRRNPQRAEQLAASRADKHARFERLRGERNQYLAEHRRARAATAEKKVPPRSHN